MDKSFLASQISQVRGWSSILPPISPTRLSISNHTAYWAVNNGLAIWATCWFGTWRKMLFSLCLKHPFPPMEAPHPKWEYKQNFRIPGRPNPLEEEADRGGNGLPMDKYPGPRDQSSYWHSLPVFTQEAGERASHYAPPYAGHTSSEHLSWQGTRPRPPPNLGQCQSW